MTLILTYFYTKKPINNKKKILPAPSGIRLSLRNQVKVVFGFESVAVQASCNNSPARTGSGCLKVTLFGGTEMRKKRSFVSLLDFHINFLKIIKMQCLQNCLKGSQN